MFKRSQNAPLLSSRLTARQNAVLAQAIEDVTATMKAHGASDEEIGRKVDAVRREAVATAHRRYYPTSAPAEVFETLPDCMAWINRGRTRIASALLCGREGIDYGTFWVSGAAHRLTLARNPGA